MSKCFACCLFFVAVFLVGCSSLGTQYVPIRTIPEGQALVYIFFPEDNSHKGSPCFMISTPEQPIVKLQEGGYYPYFTKPGELTLTSKLSFKYGTAGLLDVAVAPQNSIQVKIERGHTYYVEGVLSKRGTYANPELKWNPITDEFQAQLMLEKCKLIK